MYSYSIGIFLFGCWWRGMLIGLPKTTWKGTRTIRSATYQILFPKQNQRSLSLAWRGLPVTWSSKILCAYVWSTRRTPSPIPIGSWTYSGGTILSGDLGSLEWSWWWDKCLAEIGQPFGILETVASGCKWLYIVLALTDRMNSKKVELTMIYLYF
jgi:hypothetical protein